MAFLVLVALLVWVVAIDSGPSDVATTGTLGGMLLVLLGFEALIRWPPK